MPLTAGLAAAPVAATTLVRLDDEQLVDRSALVVTGTCDTVRSEWIGGTLFTVAGVRVENVLKGGRVDRVEVLVPGGVDRDRPIPVAVTFPGAPTLRAGERMLLFLTPAAIGSSTPAGLAARSASSGAFHVTGFSQGKLSIVESASGEAMVRRAHRAERLAVLTERILLTVARSHRIDLEAGHDR